MGGKAAIDGNAELARRIAQDLSPRAQTGQAPQPIHG
jgi:hypothetical protein